MSTAEEFAANVLSGRGVPETSGWTVVLEEGDTAAELNGADFVMDVISELELPPAFPSARGAFVVTQDRSRGQLPLIINTGPHNNPKYNR
jgi:myosin-15